MEGVSALFAQNSENDKKLLDSVSCAEWRWEKQVEMGWMVWRMFGTVDRRIELVKWLVSLLREV